jgi:hypothetical protein
LDNLNYNTIGYIKLRYILSLSFCSVKSICDIVNNLGSGYALHNNIVVCISSQEILNHCTTWSTKEIETNFLIAFSNSVFNNSIAGFKSSKSDLKFSFSKLQKGSFTSE